MMRRLLLVACLLLPMVGSAAPRFVAVDIYLSVDEPLAAWQFELGDANGVTQIVGVENGEHAAFGDAPYYDRDAIDAGHSERVIVADFSLDAGLPSGRVRIATLHLLVDGEPQFELTLMTATARDGSPLEASIALESETRSRP
ncbi:MAG: hypothetical protein AAF417_04795 [Pseudomonadota bacterium]